MMIVIGVVGGVASGKSLVSDHLRRLGAALLDADRAGHEVLRELEVMAAARKRWGDGIFGPDGQIDRRQLAQIVFAPAPRGPDELACLERLTHPRITARLRGQMEELQRQGDCPAVVLDAALLFEAGWDALCDTIVYVDAPRELRLARARQRGWSDAEFAARETAHGQLEDKRKRAHVIVDNSLSPEHTYQQLRQIWRSLMSRVAAARQ